MNDQQSMLTVREAAKMLRIGRNLAYELVSRGEIPSIRLAARLSNRIHKRGLPIRSQESRLKRGQGPDRRDYRPDLGIASRREHNWDGLLGRLIGVPRAALEERLGSRRKS